MARTSYAQVLSLPDAAQSWNFSLFLPTIPGGGIQAQNLTYRCKSSAWPGATVEAVDISLAGTKKQEAGRATYSHSFQATFLETIDWTTYKAFRGWRDYMRSWKKNTGTTSNFYKQNLEMDLFDFKGDVVTTVILAGAWPTDIAELTFNGDQSEVILPSITFSFDYVDDGNSW